MTDLSALLGEIESLSGGASDTPLEWNQIAGATQSNAPLTPVEKTLGYARSYLGGPTFGYADNLEALLSTVLGGSYSNELTRIRDEQQRFKDKTDYIDNAVEIGSGAVLNPLSWLKAASVGSKAIPAIQQAFKAPLLGTTLKFGTSAPAQAALASIGADNGENPLEAGLTGAIVGTGASALGSVVGKGLTETVRNANRLKLSAFGIGAADLGRQVKKLEGAGATFSDNADDLPLVKTLTAAEGAGIINASDDVIKNANNIGSVQDNIMAELRPILKMGDSVSKPFPEFTNQNTTKYINRLSGTARESAEEAAKKEYAALADDIGTGTLEELQKAKIGLNARFEQNPFKPDVIKAIRSDLRQEIEDRVNQLVENKKLPPEIKGRVKRLNSDWGNLAELRNAFVSKAHKSLGGDMIEDAFGQLKTTGGTGSLNIASAASGSPIPMFLGALGNAARVPESKSAIADVIRDPAIKGLLEKVGIALPEVVTGRNVAQGLSALQNPPPKENDAAKLLAEIEMLTGGADIGGGSSKKNSSFDLSSFNPLAATEAQAMEFNPGERKAMGTIDDIKADPLDHAIALTESGMNPKAKNPVSSASGIFQLTKGTAKALGVKDVFNADENYAGYKKLLAEHKARFGDDPETLYAAHYLGAPLLAKVQSNRVLTATEKKIVQEFLDQALPNFQKNYEKVTSA